MKKIDIQINIVIYHRIKEKINVKSKNQQKFKIDGKNDILFLRRGSRCESVPVADPCLRLCDDLSPVLSSRLVLHICPYQYLPQLHVLREPIVAHHAELQVSVCGVLLTEIKLERLVKDDRSLVLFHHRFPLLVSLSLVHQIYLHIDIYNIVTDDSETSK